MKVFDRVHGRQSSRVEPAQSFEKFFAARFAAFLKDTFSSPTEVAHVFGVRERTAENWWAGYNAPSGAKVARAFIHWPAELRRHLGGEA